METIVEIVNLTKTFRGSEALRGVNMVIPAGEIVGLLGPNASGKTTLLKTIAGLLPPTGGTIRYSQDGACAAAHNASGQSNGPAARELISFCPDLLVFPRWMRVTNAFTFYREMYRDYSEERAERLKRILELESSSGTFVHRLSKGMKERLSLALTFSRDSRLYLLDEPLDGIDPIGKMRVIDAILAMKSDNASVLISTHLVKDSERIFDSVYFLSRGLIVFSGASDTIREQHNLTVEQKYVEVFTNESKV